MVLHKRLDYGSSGHQVPPMPRVPTSARGKRSARKKLGGDAHISAFDLLATVAGKLLSERENSPPPYKTDRLKPEIFDQSSCNESTLKNNANLEIGNRTPIQIEKRSCANDRYENVRMTLEDHMNLDSKPPTLISSDSSVEVPLSRNESFPKFTKFRERDEDENSSACTHPSYKYVKPHRIGDRKVRKLLASKFWRAPSNEFKNREVSNNDAEMKPSFQSRKMFYTRQRTQKSSFKRRKLVEHRSMPEICDQHQFGNIKIEAGDALKSLNVGNGASSSTSGDYNVRFSIKAFMVPELFIEIPENATIGSLKRTVMEAVSTILAGGMKIGVVHQGKKVRDDKQTLLQAGISCETRMDNLGFTLEPNSTQTPPLPSLTCSEDPSSILHSATTEPIQRTQPVAAPTVVVQGAAQMSNLNCPESEYDSILSQDVASSSVDKIDNSKALVPVPDISADPLNAIPMRKSRRSELVQRRIRRPFSVTEVEALVQAVEKLGTGRWRDVKIRAFDNAKHRTYVDLKDKWKTLVHTAKISPQQRRGEPVPQELLDRVLSAHAYWTQQQAKLQIKPSLTEQCFLN